VYTFAGRWDLRDLKVLFWSAEKYGIKENLA
jgi:hypothetical protein